MSASPTYTVLGAGGYVGSHLVAHLWRQGVACQAPTSRDLAWLDRPLGRVVYCIGLTADYIARPFDTVEAHVSLFNRLLRDGDFESVVYLSSTRLYDGLDGAGAEDADLVLNPGTPRHLYDLSKALGESLVCASGRANVFAARLSCVVGGDLSAQNFLHRLVRDAVTHRSVTLETWPERARDYVHIDDVCAALVAIGQGGRQRIYNVASGENITNQVLFEHVTRLTGCSVTTVNPDGPRPAEAPRVDVAALARDQKIRPRSILNALPDMIAVASGAKPRRRAS